MTTLEAIAFLLENPAHTFITPIDNGRFWCLSSTGEFIGAANRPVESVQVAPDGHSLRIRFPGLPGMIPIRDDWQLAEA